MINGNIVSTDCVKPVSLDSPEKDSTYHKEYPVGPLPIPPIVFSRLRKEREAWLRRAKVLCSVGKPIARFARAILSYDTGCGLSEHEDDPMHVYVYCNMYVPRSLVEHTSWYLCYDTQ